MYLFRHYDNCDHMVVFTCLRKFDPDIDCPDINKYPLAIFKEKTRRHKCDACHLFFAKCLTFENKLSHKTATYFCENCYVNLHNQQNSHLNYLTYPYFHE